MKPPEADLFSQIRNAVLDLQAADYQSFALPLQKLGRLLQHPELVPFNNKIIEGLDIEQFLSEGVATQRSMVGSAKLPWPEDDRKILGLKLLLILKFCKEPQELLNFGHQFYHTGTKFNGIIAAVISQIIIPFERDYKMYVLSGGELETKLVIPQSNKVFVVHGHDDGTKESVARFLEKLGLKPIILHEQPNKGRTLITKFMEESADVGFAVVLITPDDNGAKDGTELKPRARQNVVFELGFFIGALGAPRVCALMKGNVEKPSDFDGVVYIPLYDGRWQWDLARELKSAGYEININAVVM